MTNVFQKRSRYAPPHLSRAIPVIPTAYERFTRDFPLGLWRQDAYAAVGTDDLGCLTIDMFKPRSGDDPRLPPHHKYTIKVYHLSEVYGDIRTCGFATSRVPRYDPQTKSYEGNYADPSGVTLHSCVEDAIDVAKERLRQMKEEGWKCAQIVRRRVRDRRYLAAL